jgi:hypothetical protein
MNLLHYIVEGYAEEYYEGKATCPIHGILLKKRFVEGHGQQPKTRKLSLGYNYYYTHLMSFY